MLSWSNKEVAISVGIFIKHNKGKISLIED